MRRAIVTARRYSVRPRSPWFHDEHLDGFQPPKSTRDESEVLIEVGWIQCELHLTESRAINQRRIEHREARNRLEVRRVPRLPCLLPCLLLSFSCERFSPVVRAQLRQRLHRALPNLCFPSCPSQAHPLPRMPSKLLQNRWSPLVPLADPGIQSPQ